MAPAVSNAINTPERLEQRLACNLTSPESFRSFVQGLLDVRDDDCVLEIGAGLGEQLVPIAEKARRAVGLDVSADIVEALRRRLSRPNAEVVLGNMDDLARVDLRGPFTLAYSVYSIYYSVDPARVVREVAGLLAGARARFVVVAPDLGNNEAWFSDLGQLYPLPEPVLASPEVCRNVVLPAFLDVFPDVRCSTFRTDVRFANPDELMRYYDACAPYCRPERREEARAFFEQKLARDGEYRISKRALGLVGQLGRVG
jgi:SAM-dependent methyltransferase